MLTATATWPISGPDTGARVRLVVVQQRHLNESISCNDIRYGADLCGQLPRVVTVTS